jgi:hypothetical protein
MMLKAMKYKGVDVQVHNVAVEGSQDWFQVGQRLSALQLVSMRAAGWLGDLVATALEVVSVFGRRYLAVRGRGGSGPPEEILPSRPPLRSDTKNSVEATSVTSGQLRIPIWE